MSGDREELGELLLTAIDYQREKTLLYLNWARKIAGTSGKNLFIIIAGEEIRERDILEEERGLLRIGVVSKKIQIPESVLAKESREIAIAGSPVKKECEGPGDKEILQTAIRLEVKSRDIYIKMAEMTGDEASSSLFKDLADMEKAHLDILRAHLEAIESTGFWIDMPL